MFRLGSAANSQNILLFTFSSVINLHVKVPTENDLKGSGMIFHKNKSSRRLKPFSSTWWLCNEALSNESTLEYLENEDLKDFRSRKRLAWYEWNEAWRLWSFQQRKVMREKVQIEKIMKPVQNLNILRRKLQLKFNEPEKESMKIQNFYFSFLNRYHFSFRPFNKKGKKKLFNFTKAFFSFSLVFH